MNSNRHRDVNELLDWADIPPKGAEITLEGFEIIYSDTYNYKWNISFDSILDNNNYIWACEFIKDNGEIIDTVYPEWYQYVFDDYLGVNYYLDFDVILETPVKEGTDIWGPTFKLKIKDTDCSCETPAGRFNGLVRMDVTLYSTLIGTIYYSPQYSHIVYYSFNKSQFWPWIKQFQITEMNWH